MASTNAWLLLTKTPVWNSSTRVRSLEGYKDDLKSSYSWDHRVANGSKVAEGDLILLWDGNQTLGASVITKIKRGESKKTVYRCPSCGLTDLYGPRKSVKPLYRCKKCEAEFDERATETVDVRTSTTDHSAGWIDLLDAFDITQLKLICHSPKSQHSIRRLKYLKFRQLLNRNILDGRLRVLSNVQRSINGGHKRAVVRSRIGQGKFRERLLQIYGDRCAISGPAPRAAIHAAHLYSYAKIETHKDEGGLLIRSDLHGLFDRGLLKIDPKSETISLDASLEQFPEYWKLNGRKLDISLTGKQMRWIRLHWNQHPFDGTN